MEKELIRKVKKSRFLSYKSNQDISNENNPLFLNEAKSNLSTPTQTMLLKTNSEGSSSVSQGSNFMCSHERIHINFNISSEETSLSSKHLKKKLSENDSNSMNTFSKKSRTSFEVMPCSRERSFANELLSVDDSLLENLDLSFKDIPVNNHMQDKGAVVNENNSKSSDIFNSNEEEESEDIDPEERAWDMSISVVEDKDRSFSEGNNSCHKVPNSPGLSGLVFDTWVTPTKSPPEPKDERKSLEDLLKRTLVNNAHKKLVNHSSPRSLFSSPGSKIWVPDGGSFFGLPISVRKLIKRFKGITKLYEWQEECLRLPAIEKRTNLIYALPTSGGKTLVAEILVLKEILCREKNALFVLPYVSIAQEKVRAFSPFAVELGFLVEEYAGSKGAYPPQKRRRKRSVYVATIEKALGLVHSLLEFHRIEELGLVVVDELHLIGEPKRGANLESMLTKLIYNKSDIQIVGMSATIGNLSDIAAFLKADVYTQDFRPIELTEYVKVEEELFRVDHSVNNDVPLVFHSKLSFQYSQEQRQQDPDQIGALVEQVIPEHSCLVFCPSKKNCENVALLVCNVFKRSIMEYKCEEKKALFRALLSEGNGTVCPILKKTLPFGVAYHHSGLTTAERNLLEEAFLAKTICCICCTSTLAAGVNLPARRVILRSPYIGTQLLNISRYKQMVGRAGRTGMGEVGESFLLCKHQDAQKVGELLSSDMDLCSSQLAGTGLECLIISAVDLGVVCTAKTVLAMCQCSLLAVQAARLGVDLPEAVTAALDRLVQIGALTRSADNLELSKIGKAAVKGDKS
ncbi:helicase POLQ-like isoform X1 [Homalodisca vitripennis]|uniref:helicase POLQ-like isoform X1 n=1 Tax=Homalodisca vitripennis TaxID=197043 RepID=UPI001EEAD4A9|nr:helicase POLQ-like isoform X1 [Homalodisca vitripennis]